MSNIRYCKKHRTDYVIENGCVNCLKEQTIANSIETPKNHGQGVTSIIEMPTTQDHLAVGRAIGDLLKDGWFWAGLDVRPSGNTVIILRREWRA